MWFCMAYSSHMEIKPCSGWFCAFSSWGIAHKVQKRLDHYFPRADTVSFQQPPLGSCDISEDDRRWLWEHLYRSAECSMKPISRAARALGYQNCCHLEKVLAALLNQYEAEVLVEAGTGRYLSHTWQSQGIGKEYGNISFELPKQHLEILILLQVMSQAVHEVLSRCVAMWVTGSHCRVFRTDIL